MEVIDGHITLLKKGDLIDLRIGTQPLEVSEDLVESSSPIGRILELILDFRDFLGFHSLFRGDHGGAAGVDRGLPGHRQGLLLIFSYNTYQVRITFLTDQRLLLLLSVVYALL